MQRLHIFVIQTVLFIGLSSACNTVPKGQLTFDAEGNDRRGSKYFSRVPHVPGKWSGITIGRGYDMGQKSVYKVYRDLVSTGINTQLAKQLSMGAGLKGIDARQYLRTHHLSNREITWGQQCELFKITYAAEEKITIRVVTRYTRVWWNNILPKIQQLLVDLKYRGDLVLYKDNLTQVALRKAIKANKLCQFADLMCDRSYWSTVPYDRFKRRCLFLK